MSTSADLMTTLAWSLLHFFWQGAAIAALAAVAMALFRESTTRYLIGVSALALMVTCFVATFAYLREAPVAAGAEIADAALVGASDAPAPPYAASDRPLIERPAATELDLAWVARGWLGVVCLLALRVACGLLLLEHLRRRSLSALPVEIVERCRALQRRLGISRVVHYCECRLVTVPSVIGFLRPIVLLPMRALTGLSADQLEAVIAHELGHIKRFDVAVNFLQVVVETLFFFHPAVWWLNKRIRADREDCCDDVAIAACGRKVDYARALAIMEDWRGTPELSMAATGGDVTSRVARLLGMGREQSGVRSAGMFTAALVLAAALTAGAASIGFSQIATPVERPVAAQAERPVVVAQAERPVVVQAERPAVAQAERPVVVQAQRPAVARTESPAVAQPERPVVVAQAERPLLAQAERRNRSRDDAEDAARAPAAPRGSSYIDEMKAAGFDVTDVEQLIAMKIHGVTGDFVRGIRETGLNPNSEEVMAMKIHGVTPDYIAQIRATGLDLDAEELMAMKIHGVTPELITQLRASGLELGAEEVMAMKIHGVTPEFITQVRASGLDLDAEEVMAMKIHGVTPEFVEQIRDMGFDADFDDVIAMKIHGVTPEFIEEARSHGFDDLSVEELIQLKNADVL